MATRKGLPLASKHTADTTKGAPAKVPGRSTGRPSKAVAAERRQRLIDVATRAFLSGGFTHTKLEDIARECGASKMTIYRQFGSKEELFNAVVYASIGRAYTDLSSLFDDERPPEQVLHDVCHKIQRAVTRPENQALFRNAMTEAERFPDLLHDLSGQMNAIFEPLRSYLERLSARGDLNIGNARLAAMQFRALASVGMFPLFGVPYRSEKERAEWLTQTVRMFLSAYGPASGAKSGVLKRSKGRS